MHFDSQNLNERRNGKTGSMLRHGRCWWRFGECGDGLCFRAEWVVPGKKFRFGLEFGGEDNFQLSVGLIIFTIYLSVSGLRWRWLPRDGVCQVYWYEKSLWWSLWARRYESRRKDPWWKRTHCIQFDDLLFGRAKYSDEVLSEHEVLIPMPEGSYPAKVKMETHTWKRPRWFAHSGTYANVDIEGGIPFMGKGENSWDCGEDGLYGSSMPAESVEEAIGKTVASVLESRRKYGNVRNLPPVMSPRAPKPEVQP